MAAVRGVEDGGGPIQLLMGCMGRLTLERKAVVEREYAKGRDSGKGDAESAAMALTLLSDSEKLPSNVHRLDSLGRSSKPASPAAQRGSA